jgi:hypothetical protein
MPKALCLCLSQVQRSKNDSPQPSAKCDYLLSKQSCGSNVEDVRRDPNCQDRTGAPPNRLCYYRADREATTGLALGIGRNLANRHSRPLTFDQTQTFAAISPISHGETAARQPLPRGGCATTETAVVARRNGRMAARRGGETATSRNIWVARWPSGAAR